MKINKNLNTNLFFLTKYLTLFLFLIFLISPKNSYCTSIPFDGVASYNTSEKQHYIKYVKGGETSYFYTNYLPPKGSYNNDNTVESNLESCQTPTAITLNLIGLDCMIAIPPPCPSSITGVTCLNYSNVFNNTVSKNLDPIECIGKTDGINCLSTNKPYCHELSSGNPILGINCKLPPCNLIPNTTFRRPGVNCMADCNENAGRSIKENRFFMEGFNCLKSCSTTPSPIAGNNCVYEFNDYVMPFCNNPRTPSGESIKFYNLTSSSIKKIRENCLDFHDLPICVAGETDTLKKCAFTCPLPTSPGADLNCIPPDYKNSFCHYNFNTAGCKKYRCDQLSANELKNSGNEIKNTLVDGDNGIKSDQKACEVSDYTKFSYKQLNSANFNNHSINYFLANKPCQSPDYLDTETIIKVLGSQYYNPSATGNYPFLQKIIENSLDINNLSGNQNAIDQHTPTHSNFLISLIFEQNSLCKFNNVSQKISCQQFKSSALPPNDCNSNGFAPPSPLQTCNSGSSCYCNTPTQTHCYKTGINCNKSSNQIYPICNTLNSVASIPIPDSSVSWFFKPALDPLAIRESSGVKKLFNISNYNDYMPFKSTLTTTELSTPNDNILMSKDYLKNNFNSFLAAIWTPTSPGIDVSADLGQAPISPEYICGMNNDIRGSPSEDSLYYKTNVTSYYGLDSKIIHKFEICARLMSTGAIAGESCGRRRCRANCSAINSIFEICTKNCGVDICKEIQVITDESGAMTEDCLSDKKSFKEIYPSKITAGCGSRGSASCFTKIFPKCAVPLADNGSALENARIRSFIPDPGNNYICSVLEFKGVTTRHFSPSYFDGDEFFIIPTGTYINLTRTINGVQTPITKTLFKKICVSGVYDESTGNCTNGFNTNDEDIETDVWRTSKVIRHILQPPNANGGWDMSLTRDETSGYFYLNDDGMDYYDQFGSPSDITPSRSPLKPNMSIHRFNYNKKIKYETSDCIKFSLRHSSPIYNPVENRRTAPSLFIPSLLIDEICRTGDGSAGTVNCDPAIETDFYNPAIKIVWGNKSSSYPLQDTPTSVTNYKIIKVNYDSEVSPDYKIYLRNAGLNDYTGIEKTVFLKKSFDIEKVPNVCLFEKEIITGQNPKESLIGCFPRKRANGAYIGSIDPVTPANQTLYNQTDFSVKFYHPNYSTFTTNSINIPKLTNLENTFELKKCLGNISNQGYPICIERHECTILNFECVENEKSLINEISRNPRNEVLILSLEKISKYCNQVLLPKCNKLKGLPYTSTNSKLNTSNLNGFNAPAIGNFYGWYNEACIVSGIDILDDPSIKKYVVENIPSEPSYDGKCVGFPNCTLYSFLDSQALILSETQRIREAKPKELGTTLCFEYTKFLQSCPPISFVRTPNPNRSDPFYLLELNVPDISHTDRFNDTNGHGEFNTAFEGNSIEGTCNGFYQNNGSLVPIATCSSGNWTQFRNSCIQFSCPVLITPSNGANDLGEYSPIYDPPKFFKSFNGKVHGYASWNQQNINGVNKMNGTFISCNVGFKKENSTPNYFPINSREGSPELRSYISSLSSSSSPSDKEKERVIMSIFGKINSTSYADGITPSRKCNQIGIWEEVTNPCQRITCPAINFELPSDAGSYNLNSFGIIIEKSGSTSTIRTAEIIATSPAQKISFTSTETISGGSLINVVYTTNLTPYPLYDNSGNPISNIIKDKIYAFSFNSLSQRYVQLDNSKDSYLKELWAKSGGASFATGYALRSKNYLYTPNAEDAPDQHIVYGTCNNELGYLSLGASPSLVCNHLGNWTNLNNGCVSDCGAVNGIVGNDPGHGFAIWAKSTPRIGQSIVSTAQSCIGSSSFAYPYEPINDDEGTKKDFGIGSYDVGITVDNFDSIIETSNGADYTVSSSNPLPAASVYNQQGKEYSFKIQQNYGSSVSSISSDSSEEIISLFNSNTLTLNAPTNSIWSKVTFASYGTPDYSSEYDLKIDSTNNCDFLYSKLVLALKCVGKNSCNISLSDFLNYDSYMPATCQQNLGNGQDGNEASIEEIGGTGGGGGGNSNASQGSIFVTTVNGVNNYAFTPAQNGKSFCDQNLHLSICEVSLGANAGRKVNITENDTGLFDGQSGSAVIKVAPENNTAEASKTVYTYNTPGVYTINIPTLSSVIGKTDIYFYVDYDIIGGGGGGGGEAIAPGTDGNAGSRVRGKFRIEAGKSFKVHVGGGGKAGKTGCFGTASSGTGATSSINFKNLPTIKFELIKDQNFAQKLGSKPFAKKDVKIFATNNIKKPTKGYNKTTEKIYDIILAKNTNRLIFDDKFYYSKATLSENYQGTKNSIKDILQKISKEFFISNAYSDTYYGCNGINSGSKVRSDSCSGYDYGTREIYCSCPATSFGIKLYDGGNYDGETDFVNWETSYWGQYSWNGWKNKWCSLKMWGHMRVKFSCWWESGNTNRQYWNDTWVYSSSGTSESDPGLAWNYSNMWSQIICATQNGTEDLCDGIDAIKVDGYRECGNSGHYEAYNNCGCNANRYWNGSSCTWNHCYTPDALGITSQWGYYGYGTNTSCNKANSNGTFDWTCVSHSGQVSITRNGCGCNSGYRADGTNCSINACTTSATQGYSGGESYSGGATTRKCNGTNFNNTIDLSFPVCDSNGASKSTTSPAGTCTCNTGYVLSGSGSSTATCNRIKCTAPAQTGYSGSGTNAIDYSTTNNVVSCNGTNFNTSNQITFGSCTVNGSSLSVVSGSCTCNAGYVLSGSGSTATCNRIKCTINDTDGYSGSTTIDYSGTTNNTVNCNKANYNTTTTLTYNNCDSNGKVLTLVSGTCGCATNYFKLVTTPTSSNSCISICNMTDNDLLKWGLPSTTPKALSSSSTSITCQNSGGYSGNTAVISCSASGSGSTYSLTTNCNCSTNYAHSDTTNYPNHSVPSSSWEKANSCFRQCSISTNTSQSYGTGATAYIILQGTTTKACTGAGYALGNTTIDCNSAGTSSIADANVCSCSSGYAHSADSNHTVPTSPSSSSWNKKTSCFRQCSVSASQSSGYGTGSSTYTTLEGTTTKSCLGTGYLTTDTATISCNSAGSNSVSEPCSCATNYIKSNFSTHTPPANTASITYSTGANGSCYRICNIPAGNASGWGVGTTQFNVYEGTNSINCSGIRYATPTPANTLSISCDSSGNPSISSGCPCASGYSKLASTASHTKPANVSTAGSEINYYYSTTGQTNSGTCFKECSVSASNSNTWGTGATGYTVYEGTNTRACTSSGFISGNITVNCNSSGTASVSTACIKIGCPSSFNLEGVTTALIAKTGQNTQACDASGYSGNISYYCTTVTVGGSSSPSYTVTSPCPENACTDSIAVPGISGNVSGGTGANELTCESNLGYSGTYKYYCNPLGIHTRVQSCTANICNISPDTETGTHGIGFLPRTGLIASGSFDCDANGYSGTKYYSCTSNLTATTTSAKCYKNICSDFTNPGVIGTITGKSGVSSVVCNTPGYSGTLEFYCNDSGSAVVTTSCTENQCNVISGIGYAGKNNQKISGSYACDEGYYGTVNWVCNAGNANATVTHNCTRITCNPPESAYASTPTLDYTANRWTSYSCTTGYKPGFDLLTSSYLYPEYKCETDPDGANPSIISIRNACVEVTCTIPGYGTFGYNNGNRQVVACDPTQGLMGTAIFVCDQNGSISLIQACDRITCQLPSCSSGTCPANVQNTLEDGTRIRFNSYFNDLNCKQSHYYENCPEGVTTNCGRPKARCIYDPTITTTPTAGVVEFSGKPCIQSTCIASNFLNSVIDSTTVNWSGDTYITTSCKSGFYSRDLSYPPQYICNGSGSSANYSARNSCEPITCNPPASTFGINSLIPLSWGSSVQIPCSKIGYSGFFSYNCTGTSNPGTFTEISNSCIVRSCNLTSNNPTTFANYVKSGQNIGGISGKILSSSSYFKGGTGGNSSSSYTTGGGGGGGSASFIETSEGRIIAIAGGGGGGNGGGSSPINSPTLNLSPVADSKLYSNFLGSYLIAKMQTLPIQNSDQTKTGGLVYGLSDSSNNFSLSTPLGMVISDIYFSSLGNPQASTRDAVSPNSVPSSFSVKYNTCHSTNSLRLAQTNCQGRETCSQPDINDLDFGATCNPTPASIKWAVLAGYTFKESSLTINGLTKPIKEINTLTMTFNPAILQNNKVYSFLDYETFWIKNEYWDDEFIAKISTNIDPIDTPLKIKFHRTNNTLEPKLKLTYVSGSTTNDLGSFYKIKKIVNNEAVPISKGYIKENIYYILRLNVINTDDIFWEIREQTNVSATALQMSDRSLPKRTCMTTQVSKFGMLGTIWSPANSVCSNKCPGYDPVTKTGDDRLGAGATLHYTSNLIDGGIVYWDEAPAGSTQILKMSTANIEETGLSHKGYKVFQRHSDKFKAKNFEKEIPNQIGSGVFVLERKCGSDGIWEDPKPLCATGGGLNTDSYIGNFNDTRVFLDHSSHSDIIYNNNTTKERYIKADDPSSYSIGECLDGYKRSTLDGIGIFTNSDINLKSKLTFICKSYSSGLKRYEDLTYLESSGGFDCIKYCKFENLTVNDGIEKRGIKNSDNTYPYNNETLLKPGHSISLDCKSTHTYARQYIRPNYLYNEINRINKIYNIDWDNCRFNLTENGMVRSSILSSDILINNINDNHIKCIDQLAFLNYTDSSLPSPTTSFNTVEINGVTYYRDIMGYYAKNRSVLQNVRQYFDEDAVLIDRKQTSFMKVLDNPILPMHECVAISRDNVTWSSDVKAGTDCRIAEKCLISKYHGIRHHAESSSQSKISRWKNSSDNDSWWFPLNSFIYSSEKLILSSLNYLVNGKTINIEKDSSCDINQYGRCAYYVNWSKNSFGLASNNQWEYWRKYLSSASCNDGYLTVTWDFNDTNNRKSCAGSDGYNGSDLTRINHNDPDEVSAPAEKYLGERTSSYNDAQNKNITSAKTCPAPVEYTGPVVSIGNF